MAYTDLALFSTESELNGLVQSAAKNASKTTSLITVSKRHCCERKDLIQMGNMY